LYECLLPPAGYCWNLLQMKTRHLKIRKSTFKIFINQTKVLQFTFWKKKESIASLLVAFCNFKRLNWVHTQHNCWSGSEKHRRFPTWTVILISNDIYG
jgi:hypothetical protein